MSFELSPEMVVVIITGLISLVLDYLPKLAAKFDALETAQKRLLVLVLSVLLCIVVVIGQCYLGWFTTNMTCTAITWVQFVYMLVLSISTMYATHQTTKPTFELKQKFGLLAGKG